MYNVYTIIWGAMKIYSTYISYVGYSLHTTHSSSALAKGLTTIPAQLHEISKVCSNISTQYNVVCMLVIHCNEYSNTVQECTVQAVHCTYVHERMLHATGTLYRNVWYNLYTVQI